VIGAFAEPDEDVFLLFLGEGEEGIRAFVHIKIWRHGFLLLLRGKLRFFTITGGVVPPGGTRPPARVL
jgi:hypothetical protein